MSFLLGLPISRGYVKFPGCIAEGCVIKSTYPLSNGETNLLDGSLVSEQFYFWWFWISGFIDGFRSFSHYLEVLIISGLVSVLRATPIFISHGVQPFGKGTTRSLGDENQPWVSNHLLTGMILQGTSSCLSCPGFHVCFPQPCADVGYNYGWMFPCPRCQSP